MCAHPSMSTPHPGPDDVTARVTDLLARYGYNSNDVVAPYAGWEHFFSDEPEGVVVYVRRGRVLVASGDPLCAPEHLQEVLARFASFARAQRLSLCFVGATPRCYAAARALGFGALKVGEEPIFDLTSYAPRGDRAKKARAARNHALRLGVTVCEYRPLEGREPGLEQEMLRVLAAWCASRPAQPLAFSLRLEPFAWMEGKRYFVAEQDGRLVGFLIGTRLAARDGVYLEDVIRLPDAPYGSTELLILTALETLARDGVREASLGVAPLQGVEQQPTRGQRALGRVAGFVRDRVNHVYRFKSLNHFKRKFAASRYEASYLLYLPPRLTPRLLLGLAGAFTPEGLGPFARDLLRRTAQRLARALARLPVVPALRAFGAALLAGALLVLGRHLHPTPTPALHLVRAHPWWLVPAGAGAGAVAARSRLRRH